MMVGAGNNKYPIRFHIGTQKAGSTYLYNLLKSHPHTAMPNKPKLSFFCAEYERGFGWYRQQFPKEGYKIDTSPNYFKHSDIVPERIADFYDRPEELRFVLILRNPIDYVASHFHMHKMHGWFEKHPETYPEVPADISECAEKYPEYFGRGMYADLLDKWLRFFDREQFGIFIFEEFIEKTDDVTEEILRFWDIPEPDYPLEVKEVSRNSAMRFSWLYTLRGKIAQHHWLKKKLKKSRAVNWVVDTFFNTSPSRELRADERDMLKEIFSDDVMRLQDEYDLDISRWEDFAEE